MSAPGHFFPQEWLPSLTGILQQDLLNALYVTLTQPFPYQINAELILSGTKVNEAQGVLVLMVCVSSVGLTALEVGVV